jgi:hypothetical protein
MQYFLAASAIVWLALLGYGFRLGNIPPKSLATHRGQERDLDRRNEAA